MQLGIQLHVAGLSLSNTISVIDRLGVDRSRKAVHDWVQKADLQSDGGESPTQIAVDESVIRIGDQQYWLYAAIDPATNRFLHVRLFSTYTTALTEIFLGDRIPRAVYTVARERWLLERRVPRGLLSTGYVLLFVGVVGFPAVAIP